MQGRPHPIAWSAPLALALLAAGCFHHQTYLPGVIDLRSDGSGLPTPSKLAPADPRQTRDDLEAIALGHGLTVAGDELTVEDRHYWVVGLLPLFNDSPTPEIEAALESAGTLTRVEVVEEIDLLSLVGSIVARFVLPISAWVTPPWSFRLSGRAVAAVGPAPPAAAPPTALPPGAALPPLPPASAVPDAADLPPPEPLE